MYQNRKGDGSGIGNNRRSHLIEKSKKLARGISSNLEQKSKKLIL